MPSPPIRNKGFHFHTGRKLASIVGYRDEWLDHLPESAIESFAGTGNPVSLGPIHPGKNVVDFEMPWVGEVYADAPQQSWAADYGTVGVNYRARWA